METSPDTNPALFETFAKAADAQSISPSQTLRWSPETSDDTLASIPPSAAEARPASHILELQSLRISESPKSSVKADYFIQNTLGKGGMGVVRLARQNSLRREVALKELQSHVDSPAAAERLIHEAQIAGGLEHPNIVPIHDLGRSAEDRPVLVMKRVEGTSWHEMIQDSEATGWTQVKGDRLTWNINVLIDVSNALAYAHSKKIVHRDIKPENVMIGAFGEVYLLDWGLGYILDSEPNPIIPSVAGTPAYMAPEMLDGLEHITEQTDIYLLGATLHDVLCGHGPHSASSVREALQKVITPRRFEFHENVPTELAKICQKAISYRPEDRYQSIDEFRGCLQDYLLHRISNKMLREAAEKLTQLQTRIKATMDSDRSLRNLPTQDLWPLYNQCRFGFEESLKQWPQNKTAQVGLQESIAIMVKWELARDALPSAEDLYAELKKPTKALTEALEAARTRLSSDQERRAELERMAFEQDHKVGAAARIKLTFYTLLITAIVVPLMFLGAGYTTRGVTGMDLLWFCVLTLLVLLLAGFRLRASLWTNERSRRMTKLFIVYFLIIFGARLAGVIFERPVNLIIRDEFFLQIGMFAAIAAEELRHALTLMFLATLGAVGVSIRADYVLEITSICYLGIMVFGFFVYKNDLGDEKLEVCELIDFNSPLEKTDELRSEARSP